MSELIGKGFVTSNKGIKDETKQWVVDTILEETHYYDDGTEKKEHIAVRCINSDFQKAHEVSLGAALRQLREEAYDKGFTSLIEAREAAKNAEGKLNPPTDSE
jgi:hypothetical protein